MRRCRRKHWPWHPTASPGQFGTYFRSSCKRKFSIDTGAQHGFQLRARVIHIRISSSRAGHRAAAVLHLLTNFSQPWLQSWLASLMETQHGLLVVQGSISMACWSSQPSVPQHTHLRAHIRLALRYSFCSAFFAALRNSFCSAVSLRRALDHARRLFRRRAARALLDSQYP